jgi:3-hydroxyacyl-CoA dehydrogenase
MPTAMQVIGIVGAGQMGSGIAQVCASKGLEVLLMDRSQVRRGSMQCTRMLSTAAIGIAHVRAPSHQITRINTRAGALRAWYECNTQVYDSPNAQGDTGQSCNG